MKRQDIADALGIGISSAYRILDKNKRNPTQGPQEIVPQGGTQGAV